jgi:hypothetical protein
MRSCILYRFFEPASLAKRDIEKFDTIFFCILVPHKKELFEIFFWTRIEARRIVWNLQTTGEFGCDIHTHIIAVGTLITFFWGKFESLDTSKKVFYIISSFDIGDILDFTDFYKSVIAFIILALWLDIGVIPETYDIILIAKLEYWHRDVWATADMDQHFWFFERFLTIQTVLENIL